MSWRATACLSLEPMKARFIREPLVDSLKTSEREVRPTDAALLLIELDIACSTLCSAEHWDTTVSSSSSTLPWISLWRMVFAGVLCATTWLMEPSTE